MDSEAEQHLRESFDAADTAHRGTLSRAEAQAGGFGWIARHFDAIDTQHAGRVSFDDVRRYLKLRGAEGVRRRSRQAPGVSPRRLHACDEAPTVVARGMAAVLGALCAAIHGSTACAGIGLANR